VNLRRYKMLLKDKKILIMGIRNKWSIAYGIAKSAYENGAKLIFTYMGEDNKEKIEALISEFKGSKAYVLNGASEDELVKDAFIKIKEENGKLDGITDKNKKFITNKSGETITTEISVKNTSKNETTISSKSNTKKTDSTMRKSNIPTKTSTNGNAVNTQNTNIASTTQAKLSNHENSTNKTNTTLSHSTTHKSTTHTKFTTQISTTQKSSQVITDKEGWVDKWY